jgi:hypothetical protein
LSSFMGSLANGTRFFIVSCSASETSFRFFNSGVKLLLNFSNSRYSFFSSSDSLSKI